MKWKNSSADVCRMLGDGASLRPLTSHKSKHALPDELPKKKDGRGRPRKDRTLESSKIYSSPAVPSTPAVAVV